LEKQLSTALGVEWKVDINPLAIYPYAPEGGYAQRSLGAVLKGYVSRTRSGRHNTNMTSYVEGAVSQLNYFNGRFPDIGKDEVNTICHAHTLIMDIDEAEKVQYNGCDIVDGKLRILFLPAYLGTNVGDALSLLPDVLNAAEQPAGTDGKPPVMGPQARMSIAKDWEAQIGALQTKVDKMLGTSIKLNPNWDENFAKLKASKDVRGNWERDYGSVVYQYFDGALGQMNYHKFGEDEMLQEGLLEAVEKKGIALRVVDKLTQAKATYNGCAVEDGVLYIEVR
jgi:hypothetical protein